MSDSIPSFQTGPAWLRNHFVEIIRDFRKPESRYKRQCVIGALIPLQVVPFCLTLIWPELFKPVVLISLYFYAVGVFLALALYGIAMFYCKFCITGGVLFSLMIFWVLVMVNVMMYIAGLFTTPTDHPLYSLYIP